MRLPVPPPEGSGCEGLPQRRSPGRWRVVVREGGFVEMEEGLPSGFMHGTVERLAK